MAERELVLMRCGHVAQGTVSTPNGLIPVCVIHDEIDEWQGETPDLSGRKAKCGLCGIDVPSSLSLAYFRYEKHGEVDEFYCGCRGWD